MKKYLFVFIVSAISVMSCTVQGGFVTDRPADVYYERGVAPGPDYIWIDGDWFWSGGRYQWHEGHWGRRRNGHNWVGGRWESGGKGWRWNRGHWK